jgi:DnaJ-domain-containing protein 1
MAETRSETVAREIVRALNEHEKDKQIKKQLLEMLRVVNERLEDPGIDAFLGKAEGRS